MVTFNPGPSEIQPRIIKAMQDIATSGFLSSSHRGDPFSGLCRAAVEGLKKRLLLDDEDRVFFQPSATACMDALLRNLVTKTSFHFVHGAFSKLFFNVAKQVDLEAQAV